MKQVTTKTLRKHRMNDLGQEVLSKIPKTLPMKIPSMADQVHELTRLGTARRDAYWETNHGWNDHLDDLPHEGLTEHEIAGDPELQKILNPKPKQTIKTPVKTPPSGESEGKQKGVIDPPSAEQETPAKK